MKSLGDWLGGRRDQLLRQWRAAVRRDVSAEGLTDEEIGGAMPEYLALLGRGRVDEIPRLSGEQKEVIERHLAQRLRQGFELNEILTEFALVGRCVSQLLEAETVEQCPTAAATSALFAELHLTSVASAQIFNEHLLEDEQGEKRYSRLLRGVCESYPGRQGPTRKRLEAALALVTRAIDAQAAALLLFDASTRRLVLSASVGDPEHRLEQHVSWLEPMSTTDLVVTDHLERAGIRSLVGIPLTAHHLVQGAIYVGLREPRELTPSESRRLETLAQTLAVYVENAQLYSALGRKVEELRAENALRERFISVLMHDLTGPLTSAKLNAQRLLRIDGARDPRGTATKIVRSLDRMEGMVADLLDTHRIRAGQRLPMRIEDCNLGQLVCEVVEDLRGLHGDRFVVRMAKDVRGRWSADQLRRAVWNLLDNAIKHGADESPVTITVKKTIDGAALQVHNQGPAIAPDDQARLFQPFSRAQPTLDGHPPGWGLGLTLVWGCAEAHGGGVTVESSADEGTTFTLVIPNDASAYAAPQV